MFAVAPGGVEALVPGPLAVQAMPSSDHALGSPLSVTEYAPGCSFVNGFSPPPLSSKFERPVPLVVNEKGPPPLGVVTFLIVIEPHVSMFPVEKSLRSALSACDVRVFVRNVEKHGNALREEARQVEPALEEVGARQAAGPARRDRAGVDDRARVEGAELAARALADVLGDLGDSTVLPLVDANLGDVAAVRELALDEQVAVDMATGERPLVGVAPRDQPDAVLQEPEPDVRVAVLVELSVLTEVEDEVAGLRVHGRVVVDDVRLRRSDVGLLPRPLTDVGRVLRLPRAVARVGAVCRIGPKAGEPERAAERIPVGAAVSGCVAVELEAADISRGRRERDAEKRRRKSCEKCDSPKPLVRTHLRHLPCLPSLPELDQTRCASPSSFKRIRVPNSVNRV